MLSDYWGPPHSNTSAPKFGKLVVRQSSAVGVFHGGTDNALPGECLDNYETVSNKIDMGPGDAVYIASLNTGRCEKLTLDDNSSVSFREPDPGWTMPSLTGDRRLSTDTMVLDIAASPTGNEVFVLTSPKGIHGRHTLEVYRDESLVEELPLPGPFSSVVCGPGNRVALIKDQPPARIHVYKYEGSS